MERGGGAVTFKYFCVVCVLSKCFVPPAYPTDYIDAVFEGASLWPTDPYQRAVDQLLVEDFGSKVNHTRVDWSIAPSKY